MYNLFFDLFLKVLSFVVGGQAKALMFVHINPEANAIGETISTLKFAERVASIELGAARANKETSEIRDLKSEVRSFYIGFFPVKSTFMFLLAS